MLGSCSRGHVRELLQRACGPLKGGFKGKGNMWGGEVTGWPHSWLTGHVAGLVAG